MESGGRWSPPGLGVARWKLRCWSCTLEHSVRLKMLKFPEISDAKA